MGNSKKADNPTKKDTLEIKYKSRDLKIYSSPEWLAEGKKKYRVVYDQSETTYIYFEFSFYNKLFDEEDWDVKISIKAYNISEPSQKELLCDLRYEDTISMEDNIVYVRKGWGNPDTGAFWKKGIYLCEAWIENDLVLSKQFYVENFGAVTENHNPYFKIKSIKLFEGPNTLIPIDDRAYCVRFKDNETRYVWVELAIENLHSETLWYGEFVFNFYNDARQLKGQSVSVKRIATAGHNSLFYVESGWGADETNSWFHDKYTLELVFMDQLLAVVPFEVGDAFIEGENVVYYPGGETKTSKTDILIDIKEDEAIKELDSLIGLDSIKKSIKEYVAYIKFLKLREQKGIIEDQKINLHAVFTGNPGTGKTTVAKLLGKIYKSLGFLTKEATLEVDRADLVGKYIGQTAPQTKEIINKARGGILFIDEAYSLARSNDDSKDFGREAVEILLKEISDGPGDIAVIVAGYPEEMKTFINSNPGLKSRFTKWYDFPDYSPKELLEIIELSSLQKSLTISQEAKDYLYRKIVEAYRERDKTFGNARLSNSLLDEAKLNLGLRIMNNPDPDSLSQETISTITLDDVKKIFEDKRNKEIDIPIDDELLKEALSELNSLIGMNKIKNEVNELVKLARFYKETKKDLLNSFSMHSVFIGNPGTGKTTIARIIATIYKALGLLERGHLVECDRESLVAGYVGQTALKTAEKVNQAIGGVLFIDEAYSLAGGGSSDFGREAIETLLKKMEDNRGKLSMIVAGYPKEMLDFLESNPGLKSRFDKIFKFDDYTPGDMLEIAHKMYKEEGILPTEAALAHLSDYFEFHYRNKDKFFGNARVVRKVVSESIKSLHLRLSALDPDKRTHEVFSHLSLDDVKEFTASKETILKQSQIGFSIEGESENQ